MQDALPRLMQEAQTGDRAAMELLLEHVQPLLYRFGVRMCGEAEDAKDVLQESLLAVARALPQFRGDSSASTWLYSIARSFCIKKRRRSKFAPRQEPLEPNTEAIADHAPRPDEELEKHEARRLLEQALSGLEPIYREVFVLRDLEGLSAQEAAEVLEVSVDALKSRLHRARAMLRAHLAPLLGEAPAEPPAHTCPEIELLFSRYLEGEIAPIQCAEMERHLAGCTRCRADCNSLKRSLALCKAAPAASVPEALQETLRASIRELLKNTPVAKK